MQGPPEFQLGDTIQTRFLDKDKFDDRGRRRISLTQLQPGEQGAPRGQRMNAGGSRNPRKHVSFIELKLL